MPWASRDRFAAEPVKSATRHPGLDALRGLAIIAVLIFHAYIVAPVPGMVWARSVGQGAVGVGLFYIVSALTLAASWAHRAHRDRHARRAFWARRVFRIAPLFYIALLISWLVGYGQPKFAPPPMAGRHVFTLGNLLAHLTFVFGWIPAYQNSWIGVEWSIGAEMTFYLLCPWILARLLPRYGGLTLLLTGFSLSLAWPWLLPRLFSPWPRWAGAFPFWSWPGQAVWFAAGLWIFETSRPSHPSARLPGSVLILTLAAVSLLNAPLAYAAPLWVLPLGLLTYAVWHRLPSARRLADSRWLRYVGTRSYSWYLVHWPLLKGVVLPLVGGAGAATPGGFVIRLGAMVLLTGVAGELAFRLIEEPARLWGRRQLIRWGWAAPGTGQPPPALSGTAAGAEAVTDPSRQVHGRSAW